MLALLVGWHNVKKGCNVWRPYWIIFPGQPKSSQCQNDLSELLDMCWNINVPTAPEKTASPSSRTFIQWHCFFILSLDVQELQSQVSVVLLSLHTWTLWLRMKWHGAWLYGVHRTCAEMAAVSCGTSHASAVSTPLRWILKNALYKKLVTHVESHATAVSARERRIALYKWSSIKRESARIRVVYAIDHSYFGWRNFERERELSLIHISEPTRRA